jgi:chromosome partitioning related protein ParA
MQVVSIISTKGGVGKTTTAANLGGFAADAGLRVLLLDLDVQPTLSSYFTLDERAPSNWCRAPPSPAWTWCCRTTTAAS